MKKEFLREKRIQKNLTQNDLAKLIKKDRTLITKIENGDANPSVETAKSLGNILEIDWTIFFRNEGE